METQTAHLEYTYELLDILFEFPYEPCEEGATFSVCEDGSTQKGDMPTITYDEDGIPLGRSREEIKMREKAIKDFYARWIALNPEKKVWNKNLSDYILVKFVSINETYEKAARTYESTKAVFKLSEILENAQLMGEVPSKQNNKNQKSFSKLLIMRYRNIKLTVGYQKKTSENVQYCITVPRQ